MEELKQIRDLYDERDLGLMKAAEDSRLPGRNRVDELINFAHNARIKRIGIAHCIGLQKEAEKLKHRLEKDFEVYAIDCKYGRIPSTDLLGDNSRGISCNPAGQAAWLKENQTELNISFGLCMGHDILFNQKSQAPVTTLVVKDREYRHNPYKAFEE
jgi:uncharacterized metal-binding protein